LAGDAASPKAPVLQITLYTSEAPEMAECAVRTKELCESDYRMIFQHLATDLDKRQQASGVRTTMP